MYLIIIGAGPVGSRLAEVAIRDGHQVVLVESDEGLAEEASRRLDARVLNASIAEADITEEAGVGRADGVVAVTGDDSTNLMAMLLAREAEVRIRVSVVNEPSHRRLFERLEVQMLQDPEEIVARHLYGLMQHPNMHEFFPLPEDQQVFEITVGTESGLAGRSIRDIEEGEALPDGMLILRIRRAEEDRLALPTPETEIHAQDRLLVLATGPVRGSDLGVFTGE